jgi:RNA polymerase sigma-70 factor (ECF subfamily)
MGDSDADLLERVHGGDEGAFLLVYERHRRPLFRFVYRMLGAVPPAEDVVHECFLVVLTHPLRFDPARGSLRTFLYAVARNLSLKQLRRRGQETQVDEPPDAAQGTPSDDPEPLRRLLEGERSAAVQEAVASLPPLQREVLILFEYEGHSLAEIAEVVGADTGTVKSRLHRARERLRRTLGPWLAAGELQPSAPGSSAPADRGFPDKRPMEKMA